MSMWATKDIVPVKILRRQQGVDLGQGIRSFKVLFCNCSNFNRKSVGSKNFGATATLKVRNPLSRKLWKPQRKDGYFFYPTLKEELPKFQADYIKELDKFVDSLYSRAQASRLK